MVYCPSFLKKTKGATLIEVMIVALFISLLVVLLLVALKPATQMAKSRDANRKADLQKLKTVLEDYYNDKNSYPDSLNCGDSLAPYLDKIPCDSQTGQSYAYSKSVSSYRLYTKLEYEKDPTIAEVGCLDGCGPGGTCAYNYGVSSSNVGLEACTLGAPTSSIAYGCFSGVCEPLHTSPSCSPNYLRSDCYGQCSNPANECK